MSLSHSFLNVYVYTHTHTHTHIPLPNAAQNLACAVLYLITQSCLTLHNPNLDCSPPGSSLRGIVQARVLKWVAIPFSRGSFQPRDGIRVSCIAGRFFVIWATREAPKEYLNYGILATQLNILSLERKWEAWREAGIFALKTDKAGKYLCNLWIGEYITKGNTKE